jgi:hypothetical protein
MVMRALIHPVLAMVTIAVLAAGIWVTPDEAATWRGAAAPRTGATMDHLRPVAAEGANSELAVSDDGPVALGAGPIRVRLSPSTAPGALAQRIRTLAPSNEVYLILQGLNTDVPPGVAYNVFLGLPDGAGSSGAADPHYVGTLTFFDAGPSRNAVFNVTGKIRTFADALGDRPAVTVIPAGTPEGGAKPTVDKVRLVATEP